MAVESAADRAAMFSADDWGEAALYTPPGGGAARGCTIIYDRGRGEDPDFEVQIGSAGMRGAIARKKATINADDVPIVAAGGVLSVEGETLTIVGRPNLDESGKIWTVDLQDG